MCAQQSAGPYDERLGSPESRGTAWPVARGFWCLAGLSLTLALAFQGSRGLFGPDEGRYAECAREMLATGDWLTPRLNREPHLSKPPFAYWLMAAGMRLLGQNEWGVRLGHGLLSAAMPLIVALLGKHLWGSLTGLLAGLVYATSLGPFAAGQFLTTDSPLAFWETLAVLCYWRAYTADGAKGQNRWIASSWAAFGGAMFTKGHAGLLPLLAIVAFQSIQRRRGQRVPHLVNLVGLALFAGIGLWWYVAMCMVDKDAALYFLKVQIGGHTVLNLREAHHTAWYMPFAIYIPTILLGMLPWSFAWPVALTRWVRRPTRVSGFLHEPQTLFLVLWLALPLGVFFLVSSRMPLYVLPLFAPLALLTARAADKRWLGAIFARAPMRRVTWRVWAIASLCLLLVGLKAAFAYWPSERDTRCLYRRLAPLMNGESTQVSFISRPKYGLMFYAKRTMPQIPFDVLAFQRMFSSSAARRPPKRLVLLARKRNAPLVVQNLRALPIPTRVHDIGAGWLAIEAVVVAKEAGERLGRRRT